MFRLRQHLHRVSIVRRVKRIADECWRQWENFLMHSQRSWTRSQMNQFQRLDSFVFENDDDADADWAVIDEKVEQEDHHLHSVSHAISSHHVMSSLTWEQANCKTAWKCWVIFFNSATESLSTITTKWVRKFAITSSSRFATIRSWRSWSSFSNVTTLNSISSWSRASSASICDETAAWNNKSSVTSFTSISSSKSSSLIMLSKTALTRNWSCASSASICDETAAWNNKSSVTSFTLINSSKSSSLVSSSRTASTRNCRCCRTASVRSLISSLTTSRCWISWAWRSWCNCLSWWASKRIRSHLFWWMRARRMKMLMRRRQRWEIVSWEWKRCWLWFHESKFFFPSFFLLLTHRFFHIAIFFSLFFFSRSLVLFDQQRTRRLHTARMHARTHSAQLIQLHSHKRHYSSYSVFYLNQRNSSWTSRQFLYVKCKETWIMKRILLLNSNHSTMLSHQISADYKVLRQMILDNLSFVKHDTMKMNSMKDITILLVHLRSSFSSTKLSSVTKSKLHV